MEKSEEATKAAQLLDLPAPNAMRFDCADDGCVTVYGPKGSALTNERINWLLDKAKGSLHGN